MTFSIAQLLADYGYLAVFIGSVLEGETILLLAGFAAHRGYLSFPLVVGLAFCGGALGDLIFFFLGHHYGRSIVERFPRLKPRMEQVNRLIHRFHSAVIIMVRFMYGLRIAGPVVIGASGVKPWRFVVFNLVGAAIWAVLLGGAGYLFGQAFELVVADMKHYEHWAALLIVAAAIVFALAHHVRRGKK